MNYSTSINKELELEELNKHLYSPNNRYYSIVTSYYKKNRGLYSHNKRKKLKKGKYRVRINSTLKNGSDLWRTSYKGPLKEILYQLICHPSMANNKLSELLTTFISDYY